MKLSKFDAVGVNVKVLREEDGEWHEGVVEEYHPRRGYHIQLFDGDDIWLAALDDKVQFEEELDLGDFGEENYKAGGKTTTLQTEMSFHEDELEILQDAEAVLGGDNDEVNQDREQDRDDDQGFAVPDYQSHQDYNQRSIRADLPTLPARAILLSGSVLGAAGLVTDNDEAMEGEVFFKVLFVEGGSQPAMFRCKTPIFTSAPVARSLSNPHWDGARFQFDMIMPLDPAEDQKSPYGFKIQGEIIIAVYMSRTNGGNTLLGQASFQLKDLVETGTVEFFASGVEGRSVTGAHTILSRTGEISGEVDVQLNIAWKSLRPVASSSQSSLPPRRPVSANKATGTATTGSSSRATSAARGKTLGSAGGGNKITTNARSGSAPRRPASASATVNKGTIPPPRKIVSNIQRKQREDAARIAKENLKLAHTLQQHANRNGRPSTTAPTTAYLATPQPVSVAPSSSAATLKAQRFSSAADAKEAAEQREFKATARAAASAKATSDAQATESLVRIFTELKRATALEEQELVKLKLKVGKLKVSVKQCEMSVARIRSDGGDSQSKSVTSLRSSLRGSAEISMNNNSNNNRLSRESLLQSDPKDTPIASARRQQAKDTPYLSSAGITSNSPVQKVGIHEYVPFFTPLADEQLRSWGVQDGEYKSLAEEYNVLQAVRRGLLDRQRSAQLSCENASEKQLTARERAEMIRRRVDYYRDIAGKLAIGVNLHLDEIVNSGPAGGAKNPATVSEDESVRQSDNALFDRLRSAKQEYATESAIYESGMHQIAQENALEELRGVRDFLSKKCKECEQHVNTLKTENDLFHRQLRDAMERDRVRGGESVDAYVRALRNERSRSGKGVLRADVQERLQQSQDAMTAVDRQLREVRNRQGSRKNSRIETTSVLAAVERSDEPVIETNTVEDDDELFMLDG